MHDWKAFAAMTALIASSLLGICLLPLNLSSKSGTECHSSASSLWIIFR